MRAHPSDRAQVLLARLESEHARLSWWVGRLETAEDLEASPDGLGRFLIEHVRWEERELFAAVQELADERTLLEVGEALDPSAN